MWEIIDSCTAWKEPPPPNITRNICPFAFKSIRYEMNPQIKPNSAAGDKWGKLQSQINQGSSHLNRVIKSEDRHYLILYTSENIYSLSLFGKSREGNAHWRKKANYFSSISSKQINLYLLKNFCFGCPPFPYEIFLIFPGLDLKIMKEKTQWRLSWFGSIFDQGTKRDIFTLFSLSLKYSNVYFSSLQNFGSCGLFHLQAALWSIINPMYSELQGWLPNLVSRTP